MPHGPGDADVGPRRRALDRRRRRRRLAGVSIVTAVVVVGGAVALRGGSDSVASLELSVTGGIVMTSGRDFPVGTPVAVAADLGIGSADAVAFPDSTGAFRIGFLPPAGFTGRVAVSTDLESVAASVTVTEAGSPDGFGGTTEGSAPVVRTTGAPVTPVPRDDPGLPRFTPPQSIAADCSVDVADQLNDWLRSVPDGSWIDFPNSSCYQVNDSLLLENRRNLVIEGNGSTFRAQTKVPTRETNRAQWFLAYGSDITIRDMTLQGMNPRAEFDERYEFDHNLFIRGSSAVTIDNVHGRNAYGEFISIAQGVDGTTIPRDIAIRNTSADTIGRMGIACVACDGVTVEDSVFNRIGYHVFDLEVEGDGRPGRNITYTGNQIGSHGFAFFSVGTPFQTYRNDMSNVRIVGNTMTAAGRGEDPCLPAVSFRDSKVDVVDVVIEDNVLLSHADGILVRRVSGVTIRANTLRLVGPPCDDVAGVRTISVSDAVIDSNEADGYETSYARE
jgi:hypothetical protein